MAWVKAVHVAAIALWMAGLIYLPALLVAHRRAPDGETMDGGEMDGRDQARVHMASRMAYVGFATPAAFVAILSGMALLLMSDAMHGWMFAKLFAVGLLVGLHMYLGHLVNPFDEPVIPAAGKPLGAIWGSLALLVGIILLLVLWKPAVPMDWLPEVLQAPIRTTDPVDPNPGLRVPA